MWWLYGSGSNTCRRRPQQEGWGQTYDLINTQRELLEKGVSFHWYDWPKNRIGTPYVYGTKTIFPKPAEKWPEDAGKPHTNPSTPADPGQTATT